MREESKTLTTHNLHTIQVNRAGVIKIIIKNNKKNCIYGKLKRDNRIAKQK